MRTLIITIFILLFTIPALAWQDKAQLKYNPMADKFEYATSRDRLKYNAIEDEWSYEHSNSQLRYNPMEGRFEYAE